MSTQRSVVITGASGAVGTELTKALSAGDWQVFAGVRSPEVAARLERSAESVTAVQLDVTDQDSVRVAAGKVAERLGDQGLTALVNNAGIIVQGPLELVRPESLRRQFEVNVLGPMAVTQAFLPFLRRAGGTLVNVGAATGRVTVPMAGPISASKTALESLTNALRMELKHQGIKVTIIEPGAMETPIFDKAAASAAADGFAGSKATQRLYERAIAAADESMSGMRMAPVDGLVRTVVKAVSARNPRSRYVVGRDASQLVVLSHLPEGLRDRLLMSNVGLKAGVFETHRETTGGVERATAGSPS
jgi:NAD(P)-dependent dehydrogenase (short-subunit alcohol dehydrogenase family)